MRTEDPEILLLDVRGRRTEEPMRRLATGLNGYRVRPLALSGGAAEVAAAALAGDGARSDPAALVLLSDGSGDAEPTEVAAALVERSPGLPLLAVLLAGATRKRIDALLRAGANDFLVPPLRTAEVAARLKRLVVGRRRDPVVQRLKAELGLRALVGESPAFLAAVRDLPLYAASDATVLIRGETGTGKEVVARAIHYLSPRSGKPFVAVNSGALPVELVENELFGHRAEAFTGAAGARDGLVAEAEGGTLLLDEVDCLTPAAQVKLLRFLQDGVYRPLGAGRPRTADVRIIAATNGVLGELVRRGALREDLFYRLDVLPLELPPLRERHGDVLLLASHFLAGHAAEAGRPVPELGDDAASALLAHPWPGNVRELRHVVERAFVLAAGAPRIGLDDVRLPFADRPAPATFREAKRRAVARFERRYLEDLLELHRGNITHAARTAQKHRRAFWELIRKHGIDAARFRHG